NFMGYTTSNTSLMIGLGTSSISDAKYAYAQNIKTVEDYKSSVLKNELAVFKGHVLTEEDLLVKKIILDIACKGKVVIGALKNHSLWSKIEEKLSEMESEGLLNLLDNQVKISILGKTFIRNICAVFDIKLKQSVSSSEQIFSKSI
ncbi:MAG: coproporphyrinogen III oxidase, partial [Cyclobacteriaceae bacterium]|nr:coproporphyrinogen III oxidase [Cyclobacteriaceae bacterium]